MQRLIGSVFLQTLGSMAVRITFAVVSQEETRIVELLKQMTKSS